MRNAATTNTRDRLSRLLQKRKTHLSTFGNLGTASARVWHVVLRRFSDLHADIRRRREVLLVEEEVIAALDDRVEPAATLQAE